MTTDTPFPIELEKGSEYFWCSCGKSKNQPFCDGSHKTTGFSTIPYTATKTGKVFFCGCKNSSKKPLCDGSHNQL